MFCGQGRLPASLWSSPPHDGHGLRGWINFIQINIFLAVVVVVDDVDSDGFVVDNDVFVIDDDVFVVFFICYYKTCVS